jgi:hypothetical protein
MPVKRGAQKGNLSSIKKETKGSYTSLIVRNKKGEVTRVIHVRMRKEATPLHKRQHIVVEIDGKPELLLFPDTGMIHGVGSTFVAASLPESVT